MEEFMSRQRNDFDVNSVSVELEFNYNTNSSRLWSVLTEHIGDWWCKPYSLVETREALHLELCAGGRLYEVGDGGAEYLWGHVSAVRKNQLLELTGPIGMGGVVHGWVKMEIESRGENATQLKLTHRIIGDVDADTASSYNAGWKEMLTTRVGKLI